eukprot:scaffold596_cov95-Isochrysis_galbana.AAC.2
MGPIGSWQHKGVYTRHAREGGWGGLYGAISKPCFEGGVLTLRRRLCGVVCVCVRVRVCRGDGGGRTSNTVVASRYTAGRARGRTVVRPICPEIACRPCPKMARPP